MTMKIEGCVHEEPGSGRVCKSCQDWWHRHNTPQTQIVPAIDTPQRRRTPTPPPLGPYDIDDIDSVPTAPPGGWKH